MASQYPLVPGNGEPGVFDMRIITDPDQALLDTLHPDISPDMPVYVEVALDGVPRGKLALTGITDNGMNLVAILGMVGTPGFVDIAMRAAVAIANGLGLDGAVAEAMTPAHGRLYRRALRRIGGVRRDG